MKGIPLAAMKKLETGNLKLEALLKDAGFTSVKVVNERVIHASCADVKAFGNAHANFLQASCNHPELTGCSRLPIAAGNDILVVHVQAVTDELPAEAQADTPDEPKA